MKINPNDLPDFDFMVGGFPCQTFSIIGDRCGLECNPPQKLYYLKQNNSDKINQEKRCERVSLQINR